MPDTHAPDLTLHRGLFTTLDRSRPTANAVAIKDGRFLAVGRDEEVMLLAGAFFANPPLLLSAVGQSR